MPFQPVNIIRKDSPSRRFFEIRSQLFPEDVSKIDVAIMHPPNMGNEEQRNKFLAALEEVENSVCSRGRNSTDFWYFAYQKYLAQLGFGDFWEDLNENEEVSSKIDFIWKVIHRMLCKRHNFRTSRTTLKAF